MNKKEILQHLYLAKKAHLKWVQNAKALMGGIALDEGKVPLKPTNCKFGKWYYSATSDLSEIEAYRNIEPIHNELHALYEEIFQNLFTNTISEVSNFFGTSTQRSQAEIDAIKPKFKQLEKISTDLVAQVDLLAKAITKFS